jgi:GPH family glycoside/pentoside/hexuronide:cation symporter
LKKKAKPSLIDGAKAAARNSPFVRLTIAFTLLLMGTSLVGGLGFYVHVFYLFGGDTKAGGILSGWHTTAGLLSNIVLTPLVSRLSVRFGKKEIFLAAMVWGIGRMALLWFLLDPAHPWLVIVNGILMGVDNSAIFMLCHAMIADVCDVDERDHGSRREGLFGALYAWVFKTGLALAYAVSGYILVLIGFDRALGGAQAAHTMLWLKLSYCVVPAVFFLAGLVVFFRYPISRDFAARVRAELDVRRHAAQGGPA